jgi:MFS family permease
MCVNSYSLDLTVETKCLSLNRHTYGRKQRNAYIIPATWLALWSAAGPIGIMVGSIIGGRLQDRYGRRSSLALGSLLSIVAAALCFVSDRPDKIDSRRGVFLAGKLLQGFAIGMLICMSQTYLSEVLPTALRGPTIALLPMFTLFGQLIGAIIIHFSSKSGSSDYYRTAFASQWVVSVFTLTCAVFLPESPAWLLRVNEVGKAQKSKRRLNLAEEDTELGASASSDSNDTSYLQCFQGVHRRRTIIVSFSSVLPQLFGLTLFSNASYFLGMVGMAAQTSLIFLILGILLGLHSTFVSIWSVKRFGRRTLSLSSLGAASVFWLSMGIVGCFPGDFKIW